MLGNALLQRRDKDVLETRMREQKMVPDALHNVSLCLEKAVENDLAPAAGIKGKEPVIMVRSPGDAILGFQQPIAVVCALSVTTNTNECQGRTTIDQNCLLHTTVNSQKSNIMNIYIIQITNSLSYSNNFTC